MPRTKAVQNEAPVTDFKNERLTRAIRSMSEKQLVGMAEVVHTVAHQQFPAGFLKFTDREKVAFYSTRLLELQQAASSYLASSTLG